eukprot:CFRG7568T1
MSFFKRKGKQDDGEYEKHGSLNLNNDDDDSDDFDTTGMTELELKAHQRIKYKPYGKYMCLPLGVTAMKCNGSTRHILRKTPATHLNLMLQAKCLEEAFAVFLEAVLRPAKNSFFHMWKSKNIWESLDASVFEPFKSSNTSVHLCQTKVWIQHGQNGHYHYTRWFEFVDRNIAGPYYASQYWKYGTDGAKMRKEDRVAAKAKYKAWEKEMKKKERDDSKVPL